MGYVRVAGDAIWTRGIEGDNSLRDEILSLAAGETIVLEVDGVVGPWEKMKIGKDGRPTNGLRPIGPMRDAWKSLQRRHGEFVRIRSTERESCDLRVLRPLLEEWDTPEDDEAFRDLPLR